MKIFLARKKAQHDMLIKEVNEALGYMQSMEGVYRHLTLKNR